MDAQRHLLAVEDVEHVQDVSGAAYEAEHLGDSEMWTVSPGRA
ncbi:hypothetical protein [Streptomyces anulatus]